jgi:pimeloyl-ACP methyl ester carboxylesterase
MLPAVLDAMFGAPDRVPALRSLDLPTLVVGGALDHDHLHGSSALADAIPGARLVVLEDVGHEVPTEAPDRLLAELLPFLDQLGDRGGPEA